MSTEEENNELFSVGHANSIPNFNISYTFQCAREIATNIKLLLQKDAS